MCRLTSGHPSERATIARQSRARSAYRRDALGVSSRISTVMRHITSPGPRRLRSVAAIGACGAPVRPRAGARAGARPHPLASDHSPHAVGVSQPETVMPRRASTPSPGHPAAPPLGERQHRVLPLAADVHAWRGSGSRVAAGHRRRRRVAPLTLRLGVRAGGAVGQCPGGAQIRPAAPATRRRR